MSWTVDFGAWPQKWEELPEQIAVTNKETGEWDFYMLTSKAMRMIRDAKDDANWLHAELHGAELDAKKLREQGERLFDKTLELATENEKLRELVRDIWNLARLCDANKHIDGMRLTEQAREEYMSLMEELGVDI